MRLRSLRRPTSSRAAKHRRTAVALLCSVLIACAPALADVHYVAEMHWNGDTIFEAWVSGKNGRFEIKDSSDPSYPPGAVVFTQDSGTTGFLYSPESTDCLALSASQLLEFRRDQIRRTRMTAENISVEPLTDEDGETMFGLKTHHVRLRIGVTTHVPYGQQIITAVVSVVQDYWTATDLHEQAPNLALLTNTSTGLQVLDDAISGELAKYPGFPLKRMIAMTSIQDGQTMNLGQSSFAISALTAGDVDASQFTLPSTCQNAPPPPAN